MSPSSDLGPLEPEVLPASVRSRVLDIATGLRMHVLEAGEPGRPLLLLLHGFPELAYSWRRIMPELAAAGYHVVAPDQRGYGRTTGWDARYDGDIRSFEILSLVRDVVALLDALGCRVVDELIAHDFGAVVAPWCALTRPDLFKRLVLMSVPFGGPPAIGAKRFDMSGELAKLDPPRKHYQWYYATRAADADMRDCPQGLHACLRAYFHMKSADWPHNHPHPLDGLNAQALATLPTYYVMDAHADMAETVAPHMPTPDAIAHCAWLTETDLAFYTAEFARTGFQGGLNWYRCRTEPGHTAELEVFAGRTIDVPTLYLAGKADWGTFQSPGAFEAMPRACPRLAGRHIIEGAGHWVQQEQPDVVLRQVLDFLRSPGRN